MKVLVCGGRTFSDYRAIERTLDALAPIDLLMEGGALGADNLAGMWADHHGVHRVTVRANWRSHGKAAGPKRNAAMLLLRPDLVIAFPGSIGTANMVRQARAAGIPVQEVL